MTKKKKIGRFIDCLTVLDRTLAVEGIRLAFPNRGAAVRFRQRCYMARSMIFDEASKVTPPGFPTRTPYDDIFIRLESEAQGRITEVNDPEALLFELRSLQPIGHMTHLDGSPLNEDDIIPPDFSEFDE